MVVTFEVETVEEGAFLLRVADWLSTSREHVTLTIAGLHLIFMHLMANHRWTLRNVCNRQIAVIKQHST
jgi:hypothetical protein